jgi:WD40 repeat protein
VRLWDSQAGTLLATLEGHSNWVTSVAFSPDGKRLVFASHDKTVRLWDSQAGTLLVTLEGESYFNKFTDPTMFYASLSNRLVTVQVAGQPYPSIVIPFCWLPPTWAVSAASIDPTFSYHAIGCLNGRVYILHVFDK